MALDTTTFNAAFGPELVTTIVAVRLLPTVTGLGLAPTDTPRSACGKLAVTIVEAELLTGSKSTSPLVAMTLAVLVIWPAAVGETTIVNFAQAPTARPPRLQTRSL